jgi:hypothetical protein
LTPSARSGASGALMITFAADTPSPASAPATLQLRRVEVAGHAALLALSLVLRERARLCLGVPHDRARQELASFP